jgi:3D (Asp-Asp-Asp) domain-containing protein
MGGFGARAEPTRRDMSRPLTIPAALLVFFIGAALLLAQPLASAGWAQEPPHIGGNAVVSGTDGDGLVIRNSPGLGQGAQATLAEGARVQVLEGPIVMDGHQWFRVTTAAGTGWASARYLAAAAERVALTAASAVQSAGRPMQMRVVGYNLPRSASPRTATGTTPRWGTVAVDPRVIPLGSRLLIEGFDGVVFVAEDTGSAVSGNLIDVWFDDAATARGFGTQSRTVTILGQ